ncbi:type II toxin-antitoxin system PrlF family antitoxin [Paraglaciecola sp. MB-3u-78]|uniref:type II toxin-antitoxin system PrlF family antitoxin n=1 Tax=Paraglaciecola sp. MB-3u-78 TaxID=2058332 RepID=UPI000C327E8F|nr:type II toxin-antitoxin system PrlF family antitoxin [Paraglaciecola sp. MB-3u-78]PKH00152.1 regulator [Paraglaciecola sp. MB-3u-78]
MAQIALETESTLTDRFQTTVPSPVRKALRLSKKAKIKYAIQSDGSVVISRAEAKQSDPVLGEFLSFIANDMQAHPERLKPLTASMRESVESLVEVVDIDLDAPLPDQDDLV